MKKSIRHWKNFNFFLFSQKFQISGNILNREVLGFLSLRCALSESGPLFELVAIVTVLEMTKVKHFLHENKNFPF